MGTWFLGRANVRHICQDKGYNYARVSEEVYINGFEGTSAAAKKRRGSKERLRSGVG